MKETEGRPEIGIGLIDGPVDGSHPAFGRARIRTVNSSAGHACRVTGSEACHHGTLVAGVLSADRASPAPGICPGCSVLVRTIFCEAPSIASCPEVTAEELAAAVAEVVRAGARIVNMSLGLTTSALRDHAALRRAFDNASRRGVLLVAASGNGGMIGPVPLFDHPAVVPVAACDARGRRHPSATVGRLVGRRGLLAPGVDVVSTAPGGGYARISGTSVAAPFVAGTAALLWSLFPRATAGRVRAALLRPGIRRAGIVPPMLDAAESRAALASSFDTRGGT